MKRKIIILLIALIIPTLYWIVNLNTNHFISNKVSNYGKLSIKEGKLIDKNGEIAHLRGISSHGIYWYGDYYTYDNLKTLVDTWNMNVFRIAVYTDPGDEGYVKHPEVIDTVYRIIDDCIKLDIYVVVDWHILNDFDPNLHKEYAKEFFKKISTKYKDIPNILYEICNEPHEDSITWDNNIKPYAEEIIPIIRKKAPNSLILVGTANWSKDLESVRYNKIDDDKVMYVIHSYPEGGVDIIRTGVINAVRENIPVILTETAATGPTGDGKLYTDFYKEWIQFFEDRDISWIVWNLSEKKESSSLVVPRESKKEIANKKYNLNDYLSESGLLFRELFLKYNKKQKEY